MSDWSFDDAWVDGGHEAEAEAEDRAVSTGAQMDEDYSRDQDAIRKLYAASRALWDVLDLRRPHSKQMAEKITDVAIACERRAEQIQSVWN